MPQNSQILGVNSVTNIELGKGVMPAPIIRNADWFEKIALSACLPAPCCPAGGAWASPGGHLCGSDHHFLPYTG